MRELFKMSLIGPNRRSDKTVVEQLFQLDERELAAFSGVADPLLDKMFLTIESAGAIVSRELLHAGAAPVRAAELMAWLYAGAAVILQRAAGHEVALCTVLERDSDRQAHSIFEHEDVEVGEYAGELALCLLSELIPPLDWRSGILDPERGFVDLYPEFAEFAAARILPRDTRAIVEAAERLDIPCIKLDREPYQGLSGDFRIRPNSMLMLGHCRYRHLVDGTMCVDLSADVLSVRSHRAAIFQRLAAVLPNGAADGPATGPAATGISILVSNHKVVAVIPEEEIHETTLELAVEVAKKLGVGLLRMTVESSDHSRPLQETGGVVRAIDPAPELDGLLDPDSNMMKAAAEGFVRWMFPAGALSRVPVVAITGTNGKTTTSRMINRIMQISGLRTALQCSDGLFINKQEIDVSGQVRIDPYFRQFEAGEVDLAVQETHFGRIVRLGVPYLWSNVAVCTNVTTDHIGRLGVESVGQMADVKRSVLERARDAVVLNVDDRHCRRMIKQLQGQKICLVSESMGLEALAGMARQHDAFCLLEAIDGREWIVMHDGQRQPLIAVDAIPATFNGTARFNVMNAMQAAAASHALGAGVEDIHRALSGFEMSTEMALGRLNIYDGHPFRVILDFAHNADGIRQLGEFLERQDISGRKIMLMAAAGERSDTDLREKGVAAAKYFDHLVVRSYPDPRGRDRREVTQVMKNFVLEGGADESAVSTVPDPDEAVQAILEMAREGDWLVMNWGNGEAEKMWDAIISFQPSMP